MRPPSASRAGSDGRSRLRTLRVRHRQHRRGDRDQAGAGVGNDQGHGEAVRHARPKRPASARPTCCARACSRTSTRSSAWHAGDRTAAGWDYSKAMVSVKFRFEGLPSHASVSPHMGRSALDAVELMSVGVNFMREHVKEDTRIHYVITNGGGQPNVVPPTRGGLVLPARQQAHRRRGLLRVADRDRARRRGDEPHEADRDARRRRHARSAAEPHARRADPQEPRSWSDRRCSTSARRPSRARPRRT